MESGKQMYTEPKHKTNATSKQAKQHTHSNKLLTSDDNVKKLFLYQWKPKRALNFLRVQH